MKLKKNILIFILIAFSFSWLFWIPGLVIGAKQGYIMPNFDTYFSLTETGFVNNQHKLLGIMFQLGAFGPLIGAVAATLVDGGKEGLADLWRRIIHWRIGGRWYLIAFLIVLIMTGLPAVVFGLISGFSPSVLPLLFLLLIFTAQLFTSGLGEEPGWRGFLLPRLQAGSKGDNYVWLLGLIWAIWHYPLVILQTIYGMGDFTGLQIAITILTSLAGMTMSQIGLTFIYVWLYNQTKSVWLMVVFHALSNTLSYWMLSFLDQPQNATFFIALMPWVVVLWFQKRLGKEEFPG